MKGKIFMGALASLSLFVIASACDIGLGGAVDTEAPTGTIETPPVNAIIRDSFAVKGTWKDDGSVSAVTLSLKNINTNKVLTYNGKIEQNSWLCQVNPADSNQPLVDGTYLATINLTDNGGHTTSLTRSYTVDNTPPVVILQYLKSASDSDSEIKTYGRLFTLNGKAADDNNISKIDVLVYSDAACSDSGYITTITKQNIPAAIEQNVATFGDESGFYEKIYGYTTAQPDSVQRYCKIFAYDEAQRYPVDGSAQSESDKNGNCQTKYYFQTTIEKLGYDTYKTTELYNMFNGTYSNSSSTQAAGDDVSTIIKTLNENSINVGTFKLNPNNNPSFAVIGLNKVLVSGDSMDEEVTDNNNTYRQAQASYTLTNGTENSGTPLTINITPGLDNYAIDTDTVKIYFQECDEKGVVKSEAEKIAIGEKLTSIKTAPVATDNFQGLSTNKYYKICIEGSDTKGNEILPPSTSEGKEQLYAFYLAPTEGVIELSITSKPYMNDTGAEPDTNYISSVVEDGSNYKKLKVTLTYSYNGSKDLFAYREYDYSSGDITTKARDSALATGTDATWTETIDASELKNHSKIAYMLKNEDGTNYSRNRYITLKIDDTKPVVLNSGADLISFPSATETSNSSFKFEGKATDADSGISKVYVKLYQTKTENGSEVEDTTKSVTKEASGTTNWTLQVIKGDSDFTAILADEGKKKAEIWAVDKVGLKSEPVTIDWIYKATKPTLRLTGYQPKDGSDVSLQKDLSSLAADFATGKIFTLKGIANDAFGVKKITVVQTNKVTNAIKEYTTETNGGIEYTEQTDGWVWSIPNLPDGGITQNATVKYEYKFTVTDKADLPTEFQKLTVTIDNTPPEVTEITTPLKAFGDKAFGSGDYVFKGSAKDDDDGVGIKSVVYKIKEASDSSEITSWETATYSEGNWSFNQSFGSASGNLGEGKYTLYVKAIDKADNVSDYKGEKDETKIKPRNFCVDFANPVIEEVKVVYGNSNSTANEGNSIIINKKNSADKFHLEVKASDTLGIESVKAKYGTESKALTCNSTNSVWVSEDFENQGAYNFEIVAEDKSGNGVTGSEATPGKTVSRAFTVLFDKVEPSFTLVSVKGQPIASTDDNSSVWYNSQTVSLEIEANDDATGTEDKGSGIDIIECVGLPKGSEPTASTEWTALTKKTEKNTGGSQRTYYKGSVIFPENAGKESRLYIRATDKAENEALFKTKSGEYIAFNIDMTAPEFKSLFYQVDGGSLKTSGGTVYLTENKKITVYGSCKDDESTIKEITSDLTDVTFTFYKALKDAQENEIALTSSNINKFFDDSNNKATKAAERRYWKAVFTPTFTSGDTVDFNITAKNGADKDTKIAPAFTITKDTKPPVIVRENVNFTLLDSKDKPVYMKGEKGVFDSSTDKYKEKYYVNNKRDKFTISGIATDNIGLDTVALKAKDQAGNDITIDSTPSGSASTWTFSDIDLSKAKKVKIENGEPVIENVDLTADGVTGVTLYVELTDLAGNKNTDANQKFEVVFDREAPKGVHLQDEKGKDIYFRITEDDNDDILTSNSLWNDTFDKNAGKKYANDSWSNKLNLTIRGLFDDGDILKADGSSYSDADVNKPEVSGVKKIYYKVYNGNEYNKWKAKLINLKDNDEIDSINSALADDVKGSNPIIPQLEEKRVFYTDNSNQSAGLTLGGKLTSEDCITSTDTTKKHWAKIKSNYKEQLTGTVEGTNYLVIVAEDNVGNYAVDVATLNNGDIYNHYSLNIDTNAPVVTCEQLSSELLSNATDAVDENGNPRTGKTKHGNISLNGTITEALSGVDSLTIKIDGKTAHTAIINNGSWNITLPGSYFEGLSGNKVIKAIATDKAKNESTTTVANVIVDSAAPVVNLNLTDNTTVNGKQTLKGTISDSYLTEDPVNSAGTMVLYYTTNDTLGAKTGDDLKTSTDYVDAVSKDVGADTKWVKFGTAKHGTSWEFTDINTSQLKLKEKSTSTEPKRDYEYITDGSKVYFTVKATDKAGNIGFSAPKSFTVDQDTDRPVITIKNLPLESMTSAGVWAKDNLLFGTVTDDDSISEVYVMRKNADEDEPSANDDGWGNNLLEGGIWQYSIPKDGYGVFYFKVVDPQNPANPYISSATKTLQSTPKIYDNKSTPNQYGIRGATTDSRVYLKVDTKKPEIRNVFYRLSDSTTEITVPANELSEMLTNSTKPAGWEILTAAGLDYIGGTSSSRCLWILYDFWDDNGVKEIETEQIKREGQSVDGVSSETFVPTENSAPTYRLIKFDLSTLNSGDNKLTLKVKDQADSSSEPKEYTIKIDNTAPSLVVINPQEGSEEYGSLTVSVSGSVSDEHINSTNITNLSGLYFAITSTTVTQPTTWTNIKDCVTGTGRWTILFEKGKDSDLGLADDGFYHAKELNNYLVDLFDDVTITDGKITDINKDVKLWVYSVDSLGNTTFANPQTVTFKVYTQADKPEVVIDYPDPKAAEATLAGLIRIAGSATIKAEKVASVWLKIDPDYIDSEYEEKQKYNVEKYFASDWESKLTTGLKRGDYASKIEPSGNSTIGNAIKAEGTTSWRCIINSQNEFEKKKDGSYRKVAVQAYALSSTGKESNLGTVVFTINPDKPQIMSQEDDSSVLMLINHKDVSQATKKMVYEENMWITGKWYLIGSVRHGAGIQEFVCKNNKFIKDAAVDATVLTQDMKNAGYDVTERSDSTSTTSGKNWNFVIPVGSSADGAVGTEEFNITVYDNGAGAYDTKTIKIRYDNKAPNGFTAKTINDPLSKTDTDKEYEFRNSNGQFALSGELKEGTDESGVKRIAFYFTREAKAEKTSTTKTTYFIDPMITKVSSDTIEPYKYRNNYVDVSKTGISYSNPNEGGDGLYWCETTISSVSEKNVTLLSLPAVFAQNVRKGGLCKINNVVYTIKGKSGLTITLDSAPATATNAYFALAQVIDNTSIETGPTNLFSETDHLDNKDGDCMQEGLTGTGGNYEWQATINSTNLYDGPVTLHFVYYDKAGNSAHEEFSGMICNNAPRIASITVKSDYDGNTQFEGDEVSPYYPNGSTTVSGVTKASKAVSGTVVVSKNGNAFKILKDNSAIDIEMVGGNGNLHYEYAIGTTAGAKNIKSKSSEDSDWAAWVDSEDSDLGSGSEDNYNENSTYVESSHTHTIDLPVSFFTETGKKVPNNAQGGKTWFQYKIWDDTDGTTKFVDSQNVTVQLALDVQVTDDIEPNVVIDRFKWNSASDNSLYQDKPENGHIELENDLPAAFTANGTGEYDRDPKVSGKIVLTGYVYDNKRLQNIKIDISKSSVLSTATTVAVYDNQNKTWKDSDTPGDVTGLTKGTMEANGWRFTVDANDKDSYFGESGHKVKWTFEYDTTKVTKIADIDVVVTVTATDSADKPSTDRTEAEASTEVTEKHKPSYQMDVVPYITGIKTDLSVGKNQNSWTTLSRSALGIYPVSRGSNITVEGFNLNGTSSKVMIGSEEYTPESNGTTTNNLVITTNAATTSAGVVAKTGSVESLNNRTVKTVAYNQEPNNKNNNILSDARELHIVDVYTTSNSEDKRMLDMAINPVNDSINFSAGYKDASFATMSNALEDSVGTISSLRSSYTRYFDNALSINSSGTIFTVSACGDTYAAPVSGWGSGPSHFALTRGSFNTTNLSEYRQNRGQNNIIFLESNWNGADLNNLDRYKWPSLAVTGTDEATKGYISYYDTTQRIIKFRYFTSDGTDVANNFTEMTGGSGTVNQANAKIYYSVEGTVNSGTYSQGYTAIAGANANSPYSAVGASGDTAIVSWYDSTSGALKMKYNTSPSTSFSGYQEFTAIPTGMGYVATGKSYTFTYDSSYASFTASGIDSNQDGAFVKVDNEYYELEYYTYGGSRLNRKYYYKIKDYNSTNTLTNAELYEYKNNSITGEFNISVDGKPSEHVTFAWSNPSAGDTKHEFAYQLNLLLSKKYGAYAEVDPKTNKVTVRSMQTGSGSSISITEITNGGVVSEPVAGAGESWHEVTVDNDSSGQYVAMKTDSKGGIHFAYYDTSNGDLKYAYMSSVDATPVVVTVDGYQQVGQYVDLAIREGESVDGTVCIVPYISYYSMSNGDTNRAAKVAKLAKPLISVTGNATITSANASGVAEDGELFTGNWEVFHVPTNGKPDQYRVNIGVTSSGNVYVSYLADRIIEYVKVY